MPFIPHTEDETRLMLADIGAPSIEALFDEIPGGIRAGVLRHVPEGVSEMGMLQHLAERAGRDARRRLLSWRGLLRPPHSCGGVGHHRARRVHDRLHPLSG
jgi:glycine cleavage system pyridoxal-binding protein P